MSNIGTKVYGIKTPYIKSGDNLIDIVVSSVLAAVEEENIQLNDSDIIGITESLLARAQGNYVTQENIADDIRKKFNGSCGIVFPIMSRNRFLNVLKGISKGVDSLTIQMSFPNDEVGNPLLTEKEMYENGINYNDVFTLEEFRRAFKGDTKHKITGIDYLELYSKEIENVNIILANDPRVILNYENNVLLSSIHRRELDRTMINNVGKDGITLYDLTEVLNIPNDKHGYNEEYGLLGSNMAGDKLKLFPRDSFNFVNKIKKEIYNLTKKKVEVLIYADGAFKDPVCGIWELADPVVSPGYTSGLIGAPSEQKLKNLIDNGLSEKQIEEKLKKQQTKGDLGTTPRQYTDLIGSLCDLTSGSGDKGTPVVVIKDYFKKYTDN